MADNLAFKQALDFTLTWEGGISNDPADPGGFTYRGITKKNHPDWPGWIHVLNNNHRKADEYVSMFYYDNYWVECGLDAVSIDAPLAIAAFDTAVNMGAGIARRFMKETNNYKKLIELRKARYLMLVEKNKKLSKFLKGWINRITDLRKLCDVI